MAKQNASPPPWDVSMSDGCSGGILMRLLFRPECEPHDEDYHYGGTTEDKARYDWDLYIRMMECPRWFARRVARAGFAHVCYEGLRFGTYNYPPGDPRRNEASIFIDSFNWMGPGKH